MIRLMIHRQVAVRHLKTKLKEMHNKCDNVSEFSSCHHDWKRSARACGAVGEDVSALPGQMIASSSVTLRARSSRSACKSWNICKLMSYQRAATVGIGEGHWVRAGLPNYGSWGLLVTVPAPGTPSWRTGTVGVRAHLPGTTHPTRPLTPA